MKIVSLLPSATEIVAALGLAKIWSGGRMNATGRAGLDICRY